MFPFLLVFVHVFNMLYDYIITAVKHDIFLSSEKEFNEKKIVIRNNNFFIPQF